MLDLRTGTGSGLCAELLCISKNGRCGHKVVGGNRRVGEEDPEECSHGNTIAETRLLEIVKQHILNQ